jgi:Right handed beta helix region
MRKLLMGVSAALFSLAFIGFTASMASAKTHEPALSTHSLWVNNAAAPSSPDNSCAHPGYSTVQSAVTASHTGATIHICTGTYTEQVQISHGLSLKPVDGAVTIALPATPVISTTTCDTTVDNAFGASVQPNEDGISVCGPGTVKMTGITVRTLFPSDTCNDSEYGIMVAGGATLDFTNSAVTAAGVAFSSPDNGCQGGIGIEAGFSRGDIPPYSDNNTPITVGHLKIHHSTFSGYQKNGITLDGSGSSAIIGDASVTGNGSTDSNAQNGIQVSDGAKATISNTVIADNEYVGGDDATGILFYSAGPGSKVSHSTISDNDLGVYSLTDAGSSSDVALKQNQLTNDRSAAIAFDSGFTTATNNNISGGTIGLLAYQYDGQTYGVHAVTKGNRITGASTASVEISSDNSPSDVKGFLSVTHSAISSAPVVDQSTDFTFVQSDNS